MSLRVAVIAGGPSAEAEVSRTSAKGVSAALLRAGHSATVLELDASIPSRLQADFDVVFPVTHGPLGEDGCLQGLLEILNVPYVGSGVLASALGASKPHAKAYFRLAGLPVAESVTLESSAELAACVAEVRRELRGGVVVKPASGGSAIGVEVLAVGFSDEQLSGALSRGFQLDGALLVERFVQGSEVTCGVLEQGQSVRALPPTLIRPRASGHYDFISKYRAGGSDHLCPAPFAAELVQRIQVAAVEAHRALGCRDLSRIDFLVDTAGRGSFVLLEANTLPGMTPTSLFPEAAAVAGIPFEALCDQLVRRALTRIPRSAPLALAMP